MKDIYCFGKDGVINMFRYEMEQKDCSGRKKWIFRIYPKNKSTSDFFEFHITEIDRFTGKVTMMHHHNQPELIAKGIPERMIGEANRILKKEIISSTNSSSHKILDNEYITNSAKKVWKRLVNRGKAYFNKKRMVYCYKP